MDKKKTSKTFAQYAQAFTAKLNHHVARTLRLDLPPPLVTIKVTGLYPVPFQVAAAAAGHEMGIQEEFAIAFLILGEARRVKEDTSALERILPGRAKDRYREHRAMLSSVRHITDAFKASEVSGEFLGRLVEKLGNPPTRL